MAEPRQSVVRSMCAPIVVGPYQPALLDFLRSCDWAVRDGDRAMQQPQAGSLWITEAVEVHADGAVLLLPSGLLEWRCGAQHLVACVDAVALRYSPASEEVMWEDEDGNVLLFPACVPETCTRMGTPSWCDAVRCVQRSGCAVVALAPCDDLATDNAARRNFDLRRFDASMACLCLQRVHDEPPHERAALVGHNVIAVDLFCGEGNHVLRVLRQGADDEPWRYYGVAGNGVPVYYLLQKMEDAHTSTGEGSDDTACSLYDCEQVAVPPPLPTAVEMTSLPAPAPPPPALCQAPPSMQGTSEHGCRSC